MPVNELAGLGRVLCAPTRRTVLQCRSAQVIACYKDRVNALPESCPSRLCPPGRFRPPYLGFAYDVRMDTLAANKSTNRHDYERAGSPLGVMPKDYPDGFVVGRHAHVRGQLIHAVSGVMKVRTEQGFWLVPPMHALWMPPGLLHDMQACGPVALRTLYAHPEVLSQLPEVPKLLGISPLLRELLVRASAIPIDYPAGSHESQLLQVLLGEVQRACAAVDFHLQPARDRRLAHVCDALVAQPGDTRELTQWAEVAGCSSRTLARLFQQEFSLSFSTWRQQVRLMAALARLARGDQVTSIALDLGYASPGAFSEVFRRWLGVAPSSYFGGM